VFLLSAKSDIDQNVEIQLSNTTLWIRKCSVQCSHMALQSVRKALR